MGVICFASLKGGVGKTSLSINVSDAFAERGCETLLIDLDPTAHASRFFRNRVPAPVPSVNLSRQAPLAKLFFADGIDEYSQNSESICDFAQSVGVELCLPVRRNLHVLPASAELRYFMWGRGAQFFGNIFGKLLSELSGMYDAIVIDTPPDFNVVTRNAIAVSDIVSVPVDSSEMSIHCLEEIVANAAHIVGPTWVIARTMVNRQASRVQKLSTDRLARNFEMDVDSFDLGDLQTEFVEEDIEEPAQFIKLLRRREALNGIGSDGAERSPAPQTPAQGSDRPIYLLNSMISRTEQQNRLTFLGKTAFDDRATSKLAAQYLGIARELEEILSFVSLKDNMPADHEMSLAALPE